MSARSFVVSLDDLPLEPWPLRPRQVVAGTPEVSGAILDSSRTAASNAVPGSTRPRRTVFQVTGRARAEPAAP